MASKKSAGQELDNDTLVAEQRDCFKTTVQRHELLKALSHAQNVVEKRNTVPILAHVKLEARDQELIITATDMDLAIIERIPASNETEATITVPAHTLYEIVRKLPDSAEIELEEDMNNVGQINLTSGSCKFALNTLPVQDFPTMDQGDLGNNFDIPASTLKSIIDKTKFAVSTEETRYYLNGIFFHTLEVNGQKILRAAATDCHRLATYEIAEPEGAGNMPSVIVPKKAILELRKLLDDNSGNVSISLSNIKVKFMYNDVILISKLIDGVFPDYEDAIPKVTDKVVQANCDAVAKAVDRVSTISTDKFRSVKLSLSEDKLQISATGEGSGFASEEIAVAYKGPDLDIGFNYRYLLEMLSVISGDTLNISLSDSYSPAIVKDSADDSTLFVIMPMRY